MPSLVISLDFELFWGVSDSRRINDYRQNVEGVWIAIPKMLALFRQYDIQATWATVGMLMCRNHAKWRDIRPTLMPGYRRQGCSNYSLDALARENPSLFFARPLVEQILETPGQELATHTYSHFYCGEEGASPAQFAADLKCAKAVADDLGVVFKSLVFPRNQVLLQYLPVAAAAGLQVYRGNSDHWLYREGHTVPGGFAGRAIRYADSWLPLTGTHAQEVSNKDGIANVPASLFLRPWSRSTVALEPLRLARLKAAMTDAAKKDKVCHLWWHPHNFGINTDQNLAVLEALLQHYQVLRERYGMNSMTMGETSAAIPMVPDAKNVNYVV
jgi:peptidoglycan/xylan/chitin deacetylase (PgdA/CDA1 family)